MIENLNKVIDLECRIATIETEVPERIVDGFKRLTLATGRAAYGWSPKDGLFRLGSERLFIPHTRGLSEALGYIAASRHYGVYLIRDFQEVLEKASVQRAFHRILVQDDGVRRLVLLVGSDVTIPVALKGHIARVRHTTARRRASGVC